AAMELQPVAREALSRLDHRRTRFLDASRFGQSERDTVMRDGALGRRFHDREHLLRGLQPGLGLAGVHVPPRLPDQIPRGVAWTQTYSLLTEGDCLGELPAEQQRLCQQRV